MLKNMTVLLYIYFYNISLNVLRPTFFNVCKLSFLHSPNIGKIRVKVGTKNNYFFYILSSCTNRIAVFRVFFFSLICSQRREKQNRGRNFLLSEYFLNNLLLTVFTQNTLSKLVKLLQQKMNNSLLGKTRTRFCAAICQKCVCKVYS